MKLIRAILLLISYQSLHADIVDDLLDTLIHDPHTRGLVNEKKLREEKQVKDPPTSAGKSWSKDSNVEEKHEEKSDLPAYRPAPRAGDIKSQKKRELLKELKILLEASLNENDRKTISDDGRDMNEFLPNPLPWERSSDDKIPHALPWKRFSDGKKGPNALPWKRSSVKKGSPKVLPRKRELYKRLIYDINDLFKMVDGEERSKRFIKPDDKLSNELSELEFL